MREATRIATIRGAGLSFPIASLLFVFFGQVYYFVLVIAGALIGFVLAEVLYRHPGAGSAVKGILSKEAIPNGGPSWFGKYLFHKNVWRRFASLAVIGAGLLLLAWYAGYYLMPEGIFRGGAQTQMSRTALDEESVSIVEEWFKIFRANLLPVAIILLGSALIRVNRLSMGYLVVFVNTIGYGLFLGTNSFAVAMPERMAPSLALFSRSGPYEMLALVLIAAAAYSWSRFQIRRIFLTNPEPVMPRPKASPLEFAAVAAGVAVLAAANWREAAMVVSAVL